MAALKVLLENLDGVPEGLHESYTEKDGKFILQLDDIESHPLLAGLRSSLAKLKTERLKLIEDVKKLNERLANVPEDYDPDEIASLRAKLEELEADPKNKGTPDAKAMQDLVAARKMLEQKIASNEKTHAAEVEKLKKQIEKKTNFISQLLIDEGLTKALIENNVGKEFMKPVKSYLREHVKVTEEDDDYKAVVETDTGPLDINKYVSDWIASDEGKVFVPPAKGGDAGGPGGKQQQKTFTGEVNPWSKDHWNLTKQGELLKADRVKAEKLAKAAGKTIPVAA